MPNSTRSDSPSKGSPGPVRTQVTMPFVPQSTPVAVFSRLVTALDERDFSEARKATRELRTLGYSVVPLAARVKGGRA